jgi:hypothetical protein
MDVKVFHYNGRRVLTVNAAAGCSIQQLWAVQVHKVSMTDDDDWRNSLSETMDDMIPNAGIHFTPPFLKKHYQSDSDSSGLVDEDNK